MTSETYQIFLCVHGCKAIPWGMGKHYQKSHFGFVPWSPLSPPSPSMWLPLPPPPAATARFCVLCVADSDSQCSPTRHSLSLSEGEEQIDRLQHVELVRTTPMSHWKAGTVQAWLEVVMAMPMYVKACAENVKSGKVGSSGPWRGPLGDAPYLPMGALPSQESTVSILL